MSVALYEKQRLVIWGSEQAAVKAAVLVSEYGGGESGSSVDASCVAQRLDLDDLGGEVCLVDWTKGVSISASKDHDEDRHRKNLNLKGASQNSENLVLGGEVKLTLIQESTIQPGVFAKRLVPIEQNPLVLPLPPTLMNCRDAVGVDIDEIPRCCRQIQQSFDGSINQLSAWTLGRAFMAKLKTNEKKAY